MQIGYHRPGDIEHDQCLSFMAQRLEIVSECNHLILLWTLQERITLGNICLSAL